MDNKYKLLLGDCLEKLKKLPNNSVDSVITDPPAGIFFILKWVVNGIKIKVVERNGLIG
jgi:DNA modification methylase